MGKYNNGHRYNFTVASGGLGYNYIKAMIIMNVFDSFKISDMAALYNTKILLKDTISLKDYVSAVNNVEIEDFAMSDDDMSLMALIKMAENLNISTELVSILVDVYINDSSNILADGFKAVANIIYNENIDFTDKNFIETLAFVSEELKLNELTNFLANINLEDYINATDYDPQISASDFYIGQESGKDNRYKWLAPFDLRYDEVKSDIQIMPTTESEYISIPGIDGEIVQDTTYKNRFFNIVAYSMQGLTVTEKEDLKKHITKLLDTTKNEFKTLTFQDSDTSFDVKYSGTADIEEGPSFVKATIPFESKPYGRKQFETIINGDGLIQNNGDADLGPIINIKGPITNPHFKISNVEFLWIGSINATQQLVIDNEDMTCYILDEWGIKHQALGTLEKGSSFVHINKNSSAVVTALNDETRNKIKTKYQPLILWGGKGV